MLTAFDAPAPVVVRRVADPDYVQHEARVAIVQMDQACFPSDDPYPVEGSYWWIAYRGKQPVAYAGLKLVDDDGAFLCRAGVLAQARGSGLQTKMIKARVRFAKSLGRKWVCTYTHALNVASMNNLIDAGFVTYSPKTYWAGRDVVYWWKDIS